MALFDEKDVDFEIGIENESEFNIVFEVRVGNEEFSHRYILIRSEQSANLKALEKNGDNLHFVSQTTDENQNLKDQQSGTTSKMSLHNGTRITINVEIERTE